MDSKEYQSRAVLTESNNFNVFHDRLTPKNQRLLHAALGLVTEAGEFADVLKKYIFYGKQVDKVNLEEEIGDLFWYCALAADALDVDFTDIMQRNIDKLRMRYGSKFTEDAAIDRNLKAEREILEGIPGGGATSIEPHDFNECGGDPTVCSRCSAPPDAEVHKQTLPVSYL